MNDNFHEPPQIAIKFANIMKIIVLTGDSATDGLAVNWNESINAVLRENVFYLLTFFLFTNIASLCKS